MRLRSKDLLMVLSIILLVFWEPETSTRGQATHTPIIVNIDSPHTRTVSYLDTVKTVYKTLGVLVDRSKENVQISKTQTNKLIVQSAEIAKQNHIIDSLQKIKERKTKLKTVDTVLIKEDSSIKKKKNWNIFRIFKKK